MKKLIILTLLLLFSTTVIEAKDRDLGKRNIFSIGLGLWERDLPYPYEVVSHKFGPAGALEYQRVLTHHIRVGGKLFGGGIYQNTYGSITRHIGLAAGITVVPFGKKFKYLQVSVGGAYIYESNLFTNKDRIYENAVYSVGALDFGFKFNFVDNKKWTLGVSWNFMYMLGRSNGFYSSYPLINFGWKF